MPSCLKCKDNPMGICKLSGREIPARYIAYGCKDSPSWCPRNPDTHFCQCGCGCVVGNGRWKRGGRFKNQSHAARWREEVKRKKRRKERAAEGKRYCARNLHSVEWEEITPGMCKKCIHGIYSGQSYQYFINRICKVLRKNNIKNAQILAIAILNKMLGSKEIS